MDAFFRWVWRINGVLILGLALLLIGVLTLSTFMPLWMLGDWNPDRRRIAASEGPVTAPSLQARVVSNSRYGDYLLLELAAEGTRRYLPASGVEPVTRNLAFLNSATGRGRKIFASDTGEVGRYFLIGDRCEVRQQGVAVLELGGSFPHAAAAAPVAGLVALWGSPEETTWRLGVATTAGEWREIARGVDRLEDLSAAADGRCSAILRRGTALSVVDFALDPAAPAVERELELQ